jgi:hypothetical protein
MAKQVLLVHANVGFIFLYKEEKGSFIQEAAEIAAARHNNNRKKDGVTYI